MKIEDLKNKSIAVLGSGVEGMAVAKYLIKHGIKPVLFDQKPWGFLDKPAQDEILSLSLKYSFGKDAFDQLKDFDIAFRSPGVRLGQISNYKFQITSQTKFFFENCPAKIIGVTGTKGKGTTCALIYEMLKQQSADSNQQTEVHLTGNIGKIPPLEILDGLKPSDWVVYELSSFQLQDLTVSPHIGVVLMVTQEHLDYHKDIPEYVDAKGAIVKFQKKEDFAVVNDDYANSQTIGLLGDGQKYFVSRKKPVSRGCYVKGENILLDDGRSKEITVANKKELLLRGEHNLENVCAASMAAYLAGCDPSSITKAAKDFKGLEHRLELSGEKQGVKFYNDSFSTTPETAVAAINSFSEPLIVILGGSSKNSDFNLLGQTIQNAKNIKALILVGQEAGRIKEALTPGPSPRGRGELVILEGAKNMKEIFKQIKSVAAPGDVVLLSPACASFDMFKNYHDRGEQFKQEVSSR